jgi:hypothetical protein
MANWARRAQKDNCSQSNPDMLLLRSADAGPSALFGRNRNVHDYPPFESPPTLSFSISRKLICSRSCE